MYLSQLPKKWQIRWKENGFKNPSLIQRKVFFPLKKNNVVGISPTGSGKTLAYLLPLISKLHIGGGNQLLILTPSHELAVQISKISKSWGGDMNVNTCTLIGGANIKNQVTQLRKKPEILIGTPGRILELIKRKKIKSFNIKSTLLDESDLLLQKKTFDTIVSIFKSIPNTSQFSFFSATAKLTLLKIKKLVTSFDLIDTTEKKFDGKNSHYYLKCPCRKTLELLVKISRFKNVKTLIFFNHLSTLFFLEQKLRFKGISFASLCSNQNKENRKISLDLFKKGKINLLLTTDLSARGLDIDGLSYVINVEIPVRTEVYLHRAGRVGRSKKKGVVISIVQGRNLIDLEKMVKKTGHKLSEICFYKQKIKLL